MLIPVGGGNSSKTPVTIIINGSGGTTTTIDLSKLLYFPNDGAAGAINPQTNQPFVPLKGYYLASEDNTLGVKYGTMLRREY